MARLRTLFPPSLDELDSSRVSTLVPHQLGHARVARPELSITSALPLLQKLS
jgi:hypothetical protein